MPWVYLLLKQFKCHMLTALLHHLKGPPLSLRGGPRSDLEGDEIDDGTHVLNLSEWLWRSPGAAQSSDLALQLSKKKNCHLVSRCCFSFSFFVLSNFWQSKKLARQLHRSHFSSEILLIHPGNLQFSVCLKISSDSTISQLPLRIKTGRYLRDWVVTRVRSDCSGLLW